jgi:hypothetical protein
VILLAPIAHRVLAQLADGIAPETASREEVSALRVLRDFRLVRWLGDDKGHEITDEGRARLACTVTEIDPMQIDFGADNQAQQSWYASSTEVAVCDDPRYDTLEILVGTGTEESTPDSVNGVSLAAVRSRNAPIAR